MKKLRGFIGPLGDDIPSIFPIVFAVLLFAGTVIYANQLISAKANALDVREGAVSLSYLVTEKGFTDDASFKATCDDKLKSRGASIGVKYLVTLKRFCNGIPSDFSSSEPNLNPYQDLSKGSPFYLEHSETVGETWAYCSNAPEVGTFEGEHSAGGLFHQPPDSVVLSFPIAVPCDPNNPDDDNAFTSGLGLVNVITWK